VCVVVRGHVHVCASVYVHQSVHGHVRVCSSQCMGMRACSWEMAASLLTAPPRGDMSNCKEWIVEWDHAALRADVSQREGQLQQHWQCLVVVFALECAHNVLATLS
jgi:hypothetical protein